MDHEITHPPSYAQLEPTVDQHEQVHAEAHGRILSEDHGLVDHPLIR